MCAEREAARESRDAEGVGRVANTIEGFAELKSAQERVDEDLAHMRLAEEWADEERAQLSLAQERADEERAQIRLALERAMEQVAKLELTQELANALFKRVFRYSESKITQGSAMGFREGLIEAYGGDERAGKRS